MHTHHSGHASRRHLATLLATVLALGLISACSKTPEVLSAALPAASAAAPNVSDIDVTEHVKTALLRSDLLKGMEIAVVTTQGDVRLTGVLDTQPQIDDALRIARAAEGAHAIHDELTLKK
jgi:hyperosmotically inducible periplasmic protein